MRSALLFVMIAIGVGVGVGGCGSQRVDVPATVRAPPQSARLDWTEPYPATTPALVFGVARFTVTPTGWSAEISVQNTSNVGWSVGDPRDAASRQFGVVLFPNDDQREFEGQVTRNDLPGLRAATGYAPALPVTLLPGETWKGTISAPGALAGGLWVRVSFGPFTSVGAPPRGVSRVVGWFTDHAYRLEQVAADPA